MERRGQARGRRLRRVRSAADRSSPGTLEEIRSFARYARRLRSFLADPITPDRARELIAQRLAQREHRFLALLEHAVYGNARSPYLALLKSAGIELGDARDLVAERGLEEMLEAMRQAGVYVTLDEFKGRRPLTRGSVTLEVAHGDFDNPLLAPHWWGNSSGSRGRPRRVPLDLDRLEQEAAHEAVFRDNFRLRGRPVAMWRVRPPSTSGLNNALRMLKTGQPLERWFDPYRPRPGPQALKYGLFTAYTARFARLQGAAFPAPEHCPAANAERVARWTEGAGADGRPAVLEVQTGLGVRICRAASERGLEIAGAFFRTGGESLTPAKEEAFARVGARVVSNYSMVETGRIGYACADPEALDDMHLLSDKLAVLQRPLRVGSSLASVDAFLYTTLLPFTPKVMINVESGDHGVLARRRCGCRFGELGLDLHLHTVRGHEKLTADGNHFLGSGLHTLIEELLPRSFGGGPTDYQLAQEEVAGLSKVSVVVSPAVGAIDEDELLSAVVEFLRAENRLMTDFWAQSETLRVVRREPHIGATGKSPTLHVEGSG